MPKKTLMTAEYNAIRALLGSIRTEYGYDFTGYAEASMKRRIEHFMAMSKITSINSLKTLLLQDEKLFEAFIQEVSVTVTEMFRDPLFYKTLRDHVMKRLATYPFIKIWVAGCATGEEVYSLAIVLKEEGLLSRSVIYATDINQQSLKTAREGILPVSRMKEYTINYQKSGGTNDFSSYYKSKYNSVLLDKSLKQNVVFSSHNLATDKSFSEFQLILCRNVLIYFNQALQNHVLNLFHESLCVFGYLGLGNKETLLSSTKKNCFEDVDRKEKLFIKIQ